MTSPIWSGHKTQCDPELRWFKLPSLTDQEIDVLEWLDAEAEDGRAKWGGHPYKEGMKTLTEVDVGEGLFQGPVNIIFSNLSSIRMLPEPPFPTTTLTLMYLYYLETCRRRQPTHTRLRSFSPPSLWLSLSRTMFPFFAKLPNGKPPLSVEPVVEEEHDPDVNTAKLVLLRPLFDHLLVFLTLLQRLQLRKPLPKDSPPRDLKLLALLALERAKREFEEKLKPQAREELVKVWAGEVAYWEGEVKAVGAVGA
ncbi:hypothetical protein JCM8097_000977 [Rhodosporidiobolus ruineniae]